MVNNRVLSDRSFLIFQYPSEQSENVGYKELFLPFLENVDISESQNSNIASFDLLGRAGNLFAYTGAKSRNIKLKFNITFQHVLEELYGNGIKNVFQFGFSVGLNSKQKRKEAFFTNNVRGAQSAVLFSVQNSAQQNNYFTQVATDSSIPKLDEKRAKALDLVVYWINIVRTSTLNNSKDVRLGPPIIRLNHGSLYNNIPCVCDDYSVKVDGKSTYDLNTLTPMSVEINMNLHEVRTGNFSDYTPFDEVAGDNLPGWDSLMSHGTMDPYNGVVGDKGSVKGPITGPGSVGGSRGIDLRGGVVR